MTLVHEVQKPNYADLSVQVVRSPAVADLLVYRQDEGGATPNRNEGVWCFTGARASAARAIHFTDKPGFAHLRICYVGAPGLSGWLKNHKLKGRL